MAYCATCDGEFFAGKEVLVVGGGFAAAEESVFLTTYASKVTVLVREQDFTCDATVAAAAKNNPKIDVRYQVELQGVTAGQGGLREASILNRATGRTETWKPADSGTFGVFVFAGYVPATGLVRGVVELDDTPLSTELRGFIDALVTLSGGKLKSTVVDGEYKRTIRAVRAEAYDVAHFPELRDQYGAMSVPCIVITRSDGTQRVEFGKKSIPQMLESIGA